MLCERCFGPVNAMSYMSGDYLRAHPQLLRILPCVTVQDRRPETDYLPTWFHSHCFAQALSEAGGGPGRPG